MNNEKELRPELFELIKDTLIIDLKNPPKVDEFPQSPHCPSSLVSLSEVIIEGRNKRKIRTLQWKPNGVLSTTPAILWLHGGGYFAGSPDADADIIEYMVSETGSTIFSPEYSLAPDNPYPEGLFDCFDVLKFISENANTLCIDVSRIAIAGISAGGGLAAAVSILARETKSIHLAFQMLLCPMLDDRLITASSKEMTNEKYPHLWNRQHSEVAWKWYKSKIVGNIPATAAPGRLVDFTGLPPAYISVGGMDAFRDEAISYANSLMKARIPVELHVFPKCCHAFETMSNTFEICQKARKEYIWFINDSFNTQSIV